ncbi:MAG: hypothetical protein V1817_02985, partial [Candidatus Micrarchaeota archaeon]
MKREKKKEKKKKVNASMDAEALAEYKNWREIASGAAPLDCAAADFKCGIEIHQQVNTHKLFCECESLLRSDEPDGVFKRKLHAVASELGEYDPAALHEMHRDRTFFYEYYDSSV